MAVNHSSIFVWNFSFYRYVLEPEISFTADDNFAPGPIAKFLDMPQSPLFTLNLNTPESWMVESVRTPYDIDNIYLEEVRYLLPAHSLSGTWRHFRTLNYLIIKCTEGRGAMFFSKFRTCRAEKLFCV